MDEQNRIIIKEIMDLLSITWEGVAITAGINAGIYDELSIEKPKSISEIASAKHYDEIKLDKWFYFMENAGIVRKKDDKYTLTQKGYFFSKNSPFKDIIGMFHLNQFYMQASVDSVETFKKGFSLDKLSEGKISRDYQPRVSDNFSDAIIEYIKQYDLQNTDTLLDIGCGRGNFLRNISASIPDIKLTGLDSNLFAIENGKKEINALKLSDRIKLLVGDITEDLGEFEDNSYDWCTAINVFHFIHPEKRMDMIENMLRIARKGVLMSQVVVEKTAASRSADTLMTLLWNDYTGFFRQSELDELNMNLKKKYKNCTFKMEPVMIGNSNLLVVLK